MESTFSAELALSLKTENEVDCQKRETGVKRPRENDLEISKPDPKHVTDILCHGGCPDGKGAALAAFCGHSYFNNARKLGDIRPFPTVWWFGTDRKLPDNFRKYLEKGTTSVHLAVFDCCPNEEEINFLIRHCESVGIYDHHISELSTMTKFKNISQFSSEKSGAGMAWKFYFGDAIEQPDWISFIEDRDLWLFKLGLSTSYYYEFMSQSPFVTKKSIYDILEFLIGPCFGLFYNPCLENADKVSEESLYIPARTLKSTPYDMCPNAFNKIHEYGKLYYEVTQKQVCDFLVYNKPMIVTFMQYNTAVFNITHYRNEIADAHLFNNPDIDLCVIWRWDSDLRRISVALRSCETKRKREESISDSLYGLSTEKTEILPPVDCSAIAKMFGGGGHATASNFKLNEKTMFFSFLEKNRYTAVIYDEVSHVEN